MTPLGINEALVAIEMIGRAPMKGNEAKAVAVTLTKLERIVEEAQSDNTPTTE